MTTDGFAQLAYDNYVNDKKSATLKSQGGNYGGGSETLIVEGMDGYNAALTSDKSSTLGVNCGMSTGRNGVIDSTAIVRRLTPLECERLQGFPDRWTDIDDYTNSEGKTKKTTDSARYKALGNSIAIPPWFYVLQMDLWAQIYLLDCGKRLGRNITAYREAFFVPDKRNRTTIFSYAPKEGAEETIYNAISDICVSMKAEDYLELPELVYNDIPVKLDTATQKAYDRLERDTLLPVDDTVITAGSAAVLRGKLLQLCNGAVYDEDKNVMEIHSCKIEALLETVEQLNGQHAIICYNFQHDKTRLLDALRVTQLTVKVYEGKNEDDEWNAGNIDLLLVQPASCGYGLNLQDGGHHIIWFGLTDSLELYQQTNKRLHRQGQPYPVIVHHLLVQGGTDEDVIKSLSGKADVQNSLLEALKVRIQKAKESTV